MNKKLNKNALVLIVAAILVVGAAVIILNINPKPKEGSAVSTEITKVTDSDIVIQVDSVTETPSFYPASINGIDIEVIAVKASDGSVRTAFNTCQVCYSSGKGYYKAEGDKLVCQNCGNQFGMDEVEVTKGGCNPVPITPEYKIVDEKTITVSKDFLTEATVIFQNWK
jgi:uncharacterized membrane protein